MTISTKQHYLHQKHSSFRLQEMAELRKIPENKLRDHRGVQDSLRYLEIYATCTQAVEITQQKWVSCVGFAEAHAMLFEFADNCRENGHCVFVEAVCCDHICLRIARPLKNYWACSISLTMSWPLRKFKVSILLRWRIDIAHALRQRNHLDLNTRGRWKSAQSVNFWETNALGVNRKTSKFFFILQ